LRGTFFCDEAIPFCPREVEIASLGTRRGVALWMNPLAMTVCPDSWTPSPVAAGPETWYKDVMRKGLQAALAGAAVAAAGIAANGLLIERVRVELVRYDLAVRKPGLPPGGLCILHLSDLHCRPGGRVQDLKLARLRRLLAGESYDLVALTGDLINTADGLPALLAFVNELRPRLGVFAIPGNRDYWESSLSAIFQESSPEAGERQWRSLGASVRRLREFGRTVALNRHTRLQVRSNNALAMLAALEERGVQPLVNRAVHIGVGGSDFWIAGVDDATHGKPDLAAALSSVPEGTFLLLLAHNPDIWLDRMVHRADLVLSGHTHGGQIYLPFVGAVYTGASHLSRKRPTGWFTRGNTRMFVSRGVGESLPFRLAAPPQVALIRLIPVQVGEHPE
jgi:predicted MPP superfamily phosphohydrolase